MNERAGLTKFFLGFVLLSILGCGLSSAEVLHLPTDALAALKKTHDFVIIKKVSLIPAAGLAAFRAGEDDHDDKMAEPKGRFQVGKDAANKDLPERQFQFAALSKDYLLIHHARGGAGLGYYYVLLKKSGETFSVIWVGEGIKYSTFKWFVRGLKTKWIDDRAGYAY